MAVIVQSCRYCIFIYTNNYRKKLPVKIKIKVKIYLWITYDIWKSQLMAINTNCSYLTRGSKTSLVIIGVLFLILLSSYKRDVQCASVSARLKNFEKNLTKPNLRSALEHSDGRCTVLFVIELSSQKIIIL